MKLTDKITLTDKKFAAAFKIFSIVYMAAGGILLLLSLFIILGGLHRPSPGELDEYRGNIFFGPAGATARFYLPLPLVTVFVGALCALAGRVGMKASVSGKDSWFLGILSWVGTGSFVLSAAALFVYPRADNVSMRVFFPAALVAAAVISLLYLFPAVCIMKKHIPEKWGFGR